MACDTFRMTPEQTLAQRMRQVDEAIRKLGQALASGKVTVKVGPTGGVAFVGWTDRQGVTDACAFRSLSVTGSWELRQAVSKAEALAGRKVDAGAVAAGHHSHDGGSSWHRGH